MVIAAMLEQDEDLVDVIRELRQEKGEGKPFKPRRLMEKLEVIGPSIALQELRKAVSVAVVERLGRSWDEMYGRLRSVMKSQGNCRVPSDFVTSDGYRLGGWVMKQRALCASMSDDRRRRLEALKGWSWDPRADAWEDGFRRLQNFRSDYGHCRVPNLFVTTDGFRLGVWVTVQRRDSSTMSDDRRRRLEELGGWSWFPWLDEWEEGFQRLTSHVESVGDCLVPQRFVTTDGFRLGSWINTQRTKRDRMPEDRRRRLESLKGWNWDTDAYMWDRALAHVDAFREAEGHCRVPGDYVTSDGFRLGGWVARQRSMRSAMSEDRRRRLEIIKGWSWGLIADAWEDGFQRLQQHTDREGNCRVPVEFVEADGFRLGGWVRSQRTRRSSLSEDCRRRLEALKGWSWDPMADAWDEGFERLRRYSEREGHVRVPRDPPMVDGFRLAQWLTGQRTKFESMPEDRRCRLEALKGWSWDPMADAWRRASSIYRSSLRQWGIVGFP